MTRGVEDVTVAIPLERTQVGGSRIQQLLCLALLAVLASLPILLGFATAVLGYIVLAVVAAVASRTRFGVMLHSVLGFSRRHGELLLGPGGTARVLDGATDQRIDPTTLTLASAAAKVVELTLRDGRVVRVVCKRAEDTERVMAHVGMRVEDRAVTAPLRGTVGAPVLAIASFGLTSFGALVSTVFAFRTPSPEPATQLVALLLALAFTWAFVRRFGHPRVTVGKDGVRVKGGFRERFVPFASVRGVRATPSMVSVHLDGGVLRLPVIGQSGVQVAALVERIERGMALYAATKATTLLALARDARSIGQWRADLERRAGNAVGFRDASMATHEQLDEILADPSTPLDQRVGAALMLRVADPEAPARIRVEIDRAADERVGRALEAAVAEEIDDVALERALSGS